MYYILLERLIRTHTPFYGDRRFQVIPAQSPLAPQCWLYHQQEALCSVNYLQSKISQTIQNSIRDARTPQPGEIVFNTMRHRSSETGQRLGYFQSSVSYSKVKMMFK